MPETKQNTESNKNTPQNISQETSQEMPTLRRAKTIKESIQDWLYDNEEDDEDAIKIPSGMVDMGRARGVDSKAGNKDSKVTESKVAESKIKMSPEQDTEKIREQIRQQISQKILEQRQKQGELQKQEQGKSQVDSKDSKAQPLKQTIKKTALEIESKTQPDSIKPEDIKISQDSIKQDSIKSLESMPPLQPQQSQQPQDDEKTKQQKYEEILKASVQKQETWLLLEEFLKLSGLEKGKVIELIEQKSIKAKSDGGRIYVEANTGTSALIKKVENRLVSLDMSGDSLDPVFVEKTIATILGLHDKVISSKDETIAALKSENSFLKEALVSMQEIYDDDKKTIELLRDQLQKSQEEVEFVKRKYRLMWGRVSNSAT